MKKIILYSAAFLMTSSPVFAQVDVDWSVIGGQPPKPHKTITPTITQPLVQPPPKAEVTPVSDPVKAPEEKSQLWGAKWSGRANVGATLQSGNSDTQSIAVDGKTTAKWEKHRATVKAKYDREEDENVKTVDNKSLELIGDYFYTDKWFVNANAEFEKDEIAELDLRTTLGIGVGHQVYDNDDLKLKYVLGPTYLNEETTDGKEDSSIAYSWTFDYEQNIWDGSLQIFHDHRLLVPSDDTGAYLLDTNTGVRVPLRKSLVATLELEHDIDKGVPVGTSEEDTKYSLKLGYEW